MASRDPAQAHFSDSSDDFKKEGAYLVIEDTRGNTFGGIGGDGSNKIKFKSFLTAFNDQFTSNWNSQELYGRMDPLYTFQNTNRVITVSLGIPSVSYKEGLANMKRIQALESLMYPNYETLKGVASITDAPVFKVQFANLIQDAKGGGGLHCIIPSVAFNPNIEAGFYADGNKKFKQLVPKEMSLELTLNILHVHELGWTGKSFAAAKNFPSHKAPTGLGILELSAEKGNLGATRAAMATGYIQKTADLMSAEEFSDAQLRGRERKVADIMSEADILASRNS